MDVDSQPTGSRNANGDGGDSAKKNDTETSVFIGNMPWVVQEEDLRKHFDPCGTILNVRIIRDPDTFIGKGFGYIMFSTKEEMKKAVADKNKSRFKGRDLRVTRAVEPKRLEKKQNRKRDRKLELKEREMKQRGQHDTDSGAESEESEHGDHDIRPFVNSAYKSMKGEQEIDIELNNNIKLKKKQKLKVQQELIDTKGRKSRTQDFRNKIFNDQPTLNEEFKKKRKAHREYNLIKFAKIKVKKAPE